MRFQARTIRILKENDATILAFGDDGDTPSVGVILQVSELDNEQDEALGLNGIHFEAIHTNVSGYHLVASITYDGHLVRIELKPSVQGIDQVIEIEANDSTCDSAALSQTIEMMSSHVQ